MEKLNKWRYNMDKFEVFLINEIKGFMDRTARDKNKKDEVSSWAMLNIYDELIEVLCKYRRLKNQ
jgi:hypothetical protein